MPSDQQPEIQAIRDALAARPDVGRTHWDGCATDPRHRDCALRVVLAALSRVQQACEALTRQRDTALEAQALMADAILRVQQREAERDALTQEIARERQIRQQAESDLMSQVENSVALAATVRRLQQEIATLRQQIGEKA